MRLEQIVKFRELTFFNSFLRLFGFSECLALITNVDVAVEMLLAGNVLIRGFDKLWAREHVGLHQARRLLDSFRSKNTSIHYYTVRTKSGQISLSYFKIDCKQKGRS